VVGPLKLVAVYQVGEQCVSPNPRVWKAFIKIQAEGGTGVYTYFVDGKPVTLSADNVYEYVVTDGSAFKAVKISVTSGGRTLAHEPLQVNVPKGC
jgi:hypothetical protein